MIEQDVNEFSESDSEMNVPEGAAREAGFSSFLKWFSKLSIIRQTGLMLSVVFALALSIATVIWSQADSYSFLFDNLSKQGSIEIIDQLNQLGIDYKVDSGSGRIKVPGFNLEKIKLAVQGLPGKQLPGYQFFNKEFGFESQKEIELLRFQRVLEAEIEKTISSIEKIKTARVLLAFPKASAVSKNNTLPSASVVVNLYPEVSLDQGQIEAVINLVSSSVSMLDSSQIIVVDQKGNMLSANDSSAALYLANKQFEFKKNIEERLIQRVNNILWPLVGPDEMQAQVSASIDFKIFDKKEKFQVLDQSMLSTEEIPFNLSRQVLPQTTNGELAKQFSLSDNNYELDESMSLTRLERGIIRRLSVAVVIDNKKVIQSDGVVTQEAYSDKELEQLKELVMQVVGFDNGRGDQVVVSNIVFRNSDDLETFPEIPLWRQEWVMGAVKQLAVILVVSMLFFAVLRFAGRKFLARKKGSETQFDGHTKTEMEGEILAMNNQGNSLAIHNGEALLWLDEPQAYAKRLEYIQKLIDEDSQLVSQVVSEWLKADV